MTSPGGSAPWRGDLLTGTAFWAMASEMSLALMGLLVTGSLTLCLERAEGVEPAKVERVIGVLAEKVRERTTRPPAIGCSSAHTTVKLSLFGGPARILVLVERSGPPEPIQKSRLELARNDESGWAGALATLAAEIAPRVSIEPEARPEITTAPVRDELERAPRPWTWYAGWTALSFGLASSGVGIGFGLSAAATQSTLAGQRYTASELDSLDARLDRDTGLAAAFTATGVASLIAGAVLLLIDSTP